MIELLWMFFDSVACASNDKLVIHKTIEFFLCLYCNRTAVEGQNDRLKSIVLGWRESYKAPFFFFFFFFVFFILFPIVIYCQIFLQFFFRWHRVVSTDRETCMKEEQRGKREEKKKKRGILVAEISGIVICPITNLRETGMGGILLTNRRHSGFYFVSGALDLSCFSINHKMICWLMGYNMPPCLGTWRKERREKGKGRLQVTMNWISGT